MNVLATMKYRRPKAVMRAFYDHARFERIGTGNYATFADFKQGDKVTILYNNCKARVTFTVKSVIPDSLLR